MTSSSQWSILGWRARIIIFVSVLLTMTASAASSFTAFETGQVRPLALSKDGKRLFAVNTPDNRLEIYAVVPISTSAPAGLVHTGSVSVGLEPVAVAVRNDNEVWVVNHLSDSISIVDVSITTPPTPPRVKRTLLVGDEPRDIVFAGPIVNNYPSRAFITTAHRGQNSLYLDYDATNPNSVFSPGELMTPTRPADGTPIGRADVWVFDVTNMGSALNGPPFKVISLFGDTPRALAVSPDGNTVYAAVFHSGNRTTTLSEGLVPNGSLPPPNNVTMVTGLPPPNPATLPQPEVGLIVKYMKNITDGSFHWRDERGESGPNWDNQVKFNLPDWDVFAINANELTQRKAFSGVGTILSNMAVSPSTSSYPDGKLYVSNTEARNEVRFEGSRPPAPELGHDYSTVQGRLHETRITVIVPELANTATNNVLARHLNKHLTQPGISYNSPGQIEKDKSLALPRGVAISDDGATLYVAAKGSDKIGIFNAGQIESDTFTPDVANQLALTPAGSNGLGPEGLVFAKSLVAGVGPRLYVTTRFDNGISIINTTDRTQKHITMPNPEPLLLANGRRFLYDARLSSSNGEAACGSCHVDGDLDSLAWDLGNPLGKVLANPDPNEVASSPFHPMKGPMTTQSLRGMANHGPMHWRGDRTGGTNDPVTGRAGTSSQPNTGIFDEVAAFKKFSVAFESLQGAKNRPNSTSPLTDLQMQAFTDFILQVSYPPNPIRNLDNTTLTSAQAAGKAFFEGPASCDTNPETCRCTFCHVLNPKGNDSFDLDNNGIPDVTMPGFFGTDGDMSYRAKVFMAANFKLVTQDFKTPHLRNLYQKVGMFGMPAVEGINSGDNDDMGNQIRGFGFTHDGSVDTVFRRHKFQLFDTAFDTDIQIGDQQRRQIAQFLFAFDSNLAPIVGQQITLNNSNTSANNRTTAEPRIALMTQRACATRDTQNKCVSECDVVVKGKISGTPRGWVYIPDTALFKSDIQSEVIFLPLNTLIQVASLAEHELTFSCVPPGSGQRIGIDRDGDGVWDGDEVPKNVVASAGAPGQKKITVTWGAPTSTGGSGVSGYEILRKSPTGVISSSTVAGNVFSITDSKLTVGATWTYQVRTKDTAGNFSEYSTPPKSATAQ
jgi:sugar lactone lactonase YvrE